MAWFLTGVTAPAWRQSMALGTAAASTSAYWKVEEGAFFSDLRQWR